MWRALSLLLAVAAACGRVGFGAGDDGGNAAGDGARSDGRAGDGHIGDGKLGSGSDAGSAGNGLCPTFAFFCDGFETGNTSKWTTTTDDGSGTLVVQSTTKHSGNYALTATMPPGSSQGTSATVDEMFTTLSSGTLAMRAWVYLPNTLTDYEGVLQPYNTANNDYVLIAGNDSEVWDATEDANGGSSTDYATTTTIAVNTWVCLELDYTFVIGAPPIALYIDDTQVLNTTGTSNTPAFDLIHLGAARAGTGEVTIIDDVAFATQHIGCN